MVTRQHSFSSFGFIAEALQSFRPKVQPFTLHHTRKLHVDNISETVMKFIYHTYKPQKICKLYS